MTHPLVGAVVLEPVDVARARPCDKIEIAVFVDVDQRCLTEQGAARLVDGVLAKRERPIGRHQRGRIAGRVRFDDRSGRIDDWIRRARGIDGRE